MIGFNYVVCKSADDCRMCVWVVVGNSMEKNPKIHTRALVRDGTHHYISYYRL